MADPLRALGHPPPHSALAAARSIALAVTLALAAGGCSVFGPGALFGGKTTLQVTVAKDVNASFPVAVDVVYAYDKKVAAAIVAQPASEWFAGRQQFARDNPGTFVAYSWEWVPGQTVPPKVVEYGVGAFPAVIFASYTSPGAHRQQIDVGKNFSIQLGRDDFSIKPLSR